MQLTHAHEDQEFWSDVYAGRSIAIFQHHGRWLVYLDHVLQARVAFATPDQAIIWLTERIDAGVPSRLN
jgi:hypothetical protein